MSAHFIAVRAIVLCISSFMLLAPSVQGAPASQATPEPRCRDGIGVGQADSTPLASQEHSPAMPPADSTENIDQWYVEMMMPHHQSIIALAEVALPRLNDDRLRAIATSIIETQREEIDRLAALQPARSQEHAPRAGHDAESDVSPQPHLSHQDGSADSQSLLMDAAALVEAFCSEPNADLAFIDLVIPHHQMAIDASRVVLAQGTDPLVQEIARTVIAAQEQEIEELTAIGVDLGAQATPASANAQP